VSQTEQMKRTAAYKAAEWIEEGMTVGLGTGSTVRHLLDAIADRRAAGELRDINCVPTSDDTHRRATDLGIPLSDLSRHPKIDLTIDGADEVDPELDLIKGLGGALLREKLVAVASARFVVMVDESKLVPRLGTRAPLPVEIDRFSLGIQAPFLTDLGADPKLRMTPAGEPFSTDGGNLILDCWFSDGISSPGELGAVLDSRPGIFEHGMFLGMTEAVVVAGSEGVEILKRTVKR
jgi:ribose 5-phosphate isomerase A